MNELIINQIQTNDPALSTVRLYLVDEDDTFLMTLGRSLRYNTVVQRLYIVGRNEKVTINGWNALFQMLTINKSIYELEFWCSNLNFDSAKVFATTVLLKNTTLTKLSFFDNPISMNGVSTIFDALCKNPNGLTIESLNLSAMIKDNDTKLQKKLAKKCRTLLQQNRTKLKELDLSRNILGDDFVTILSDGLINNTILKTIKISKITSIGAMALANALHYNRTLVNLNLSRNCIGDDGVIAIAHTLLCNAKLETIRLDGNRITDIGAKAVANALYYNRTLIDIQLMDNYIGDDGAVAIGTAIRYHPTLKSISMSKNYNITEDGFAKTIQCLEYNEALEKFDFHNEHYNIEHCTALVQSVLYYNYTIVYFHLDSYHRNIVQVQDKRPAYKKGLRRRQQCYIWFYYDWIWINNTSNNKEESKKESFHDTFDDSKS